MPCDDCRTSHCPPGVRRQRLHEQLMASLAGPRRFPSTGDLLLANLVARTLATTDAGHVDESNRAHEDSSNRRALPSPRRDPLDEALLDRPAEQAETSRHTTRGGYL